MKLSNQILLCVALVSIAKGAVQVDSSHSFTGTPGVYQNTGDITLAFTVDGAGNVTLDASCQDPDPAAYIDELDGPAGTLSESSVWGCRFSIILTGTGNLRISNSGTGLCIQGQNAQRLDKANEAIHVTTSLTGLPTGTRLEYTAIDHAYTTTTPGTLMDIDEVSYSLCGASGVVDISAQEIWVHSGLSGTFTISSASDTDNQGFVLAGFSFDIVAISLEDFVAFDNGGGEGTWTTAANWDPDGLPSGPDKALIDGYDVVVEAAVAAVPAELHLKNGSLEVTSGGSLSVDSLNIHDTGEVLLSIAGVLAVAEGYIGSAEVLEVNPMTCTITLSGSGHWNFSSGLELGTSLAADVDLILDGSNAEIDYTGASAADGFVLGSAATIATCPDSGGTSPLALGAARLRLENGSEWILDGSNYSGSLNVGDRFYLAQYGSFSGSIRGIRFRNFDLPADRDLQLFNTGDDSTAGSLYYEVAAQTPATGPNIIIVNLDDMTGGHHFGFEGRDCLTPTLDALASGGINFTEAFAGSTVCAPSRYALLTGRYPTRNTSETYLSRFPPGRMARFDNVSTKLETDGQNLGAWLQQAGYRTGFVGKSHIMDWPALETYGQTVDPAVDLGVNGKMRHNHRVLCQLKRTLGFDFAGGIYGANLKELNNDYLNYHHQEWLTKYALQFIEENHGRRFFLYMAPTINHGPIRNDLSRSLRADPRYTGEGFIPDADYSFMPTRQAIIDEVTAAGKILNTARETWVDYSMAAIINKLSEHGVTDDTLLVFTADHGWNTILADTVRRGKSSLYDAGMRIPLLFHWPAGISSPGRIYDELVQNVDFAPTILELAGATAIPARPLDGVSLVPVLDGGSGPVRDEAYAEIGYARSVRTKRWKYIALRYTPEVYQQIKEGYFWKEYYTGEYTLTRPYYIQNAGLGAQTAAWYPHYFDDDQLYDLAADPQEQNNIYGSYPIIMLDLERRLESHYDTQNPIQHLTASVPASVCVDENDAVTVWKDQSGAGNDATPAAGSVYYPGVSLSASGLPGLDFGALRNSLELFTAGGSDSWLDQSGNAHGFAVMIAFKCDALHSGGNDLLGNSGSTSGFGLRYSASGQAAGYLGGQSFQSSGNHMISAGSTVVMAFNYDAMTGEYEFWDSMNSGSQYGTIGTVSAADFSRIAGVTVGSMTESSRYIDGMAGEIIIYDTTLRPAEFHAERRALADKWAAPFPGDIDKSGEVNLADLEIFGERWLQDSMIGNLDYVGLVDLSDFSRMSEVWLRRY